MCWVAGALLLQALPPLTRYMWAKKLVLLSCGLEKHCTAVHQPSSVLRLWQCCPCASCSLHALSVKGSCHSE